MGIYADGSIYGITIYNFDEGNDFNNTLFEQKYDEIMSHQQMREAYLFYMSLREKEGVLFKIYTRCCSTHDINDKEFMMWYPLSLNAFLENFTPSEVLFNIL
jgi:hypothetical protein